MFVALALTTEQALQFPDGPVRITKSECGKTSCSYTYAIGAQEFDKTFDIYPEVELAIEHFGETILRRKLYFDTDFEPQIELGPKLDSQQTHEGYYLQRREGLYFTGSSQPICSEHFGGFCYHINYAAASTANPIVASNSIQVTCLGCKVYYLNTVAFSPYINETLSIVQRFMIFIICVALLEVLSFSGLIYVKKSPKAKK